MTTPVPHGYADWQRQQAVTDTTFFSDARTTSITVAFGTFFVGMYEAISLNFTSAGGVALIDISFWQDGAATISMGGHEICLSNSGAYRANVVPLGPYMKVTITPTVAPFTYTAIVGAAKWPSIQQDIYNSNVLIAGDSVNIAAGGNVKLKALHVWPGPATWSVAVPAGAWSAELIYVDTAGTDTSFDHSHQASAGQQIRSQVHLPAAICGINVQNTSGAAAAFQIFLVARPVFNSLG